MGISLSYSTYTANLRSSDLGDILRFSSQAVTRTLKGGLPKIFKDPSWPVLEIRQYSFSSLTLAQITDFENLYRESIGMVITLIESYGVSITGIIMNPTIEILTIRDNCAYDLEFEFLATIVSYPVGNCIESTLYTTVTPTVGQTNYHLTFENLFIYGFYTEDETQRLQSETGEYLMIESY